MLNEQSDTRPPYSNINCQIRSYCLAISIGTAVKRAADLILNPALRRKSEKNTMCPATFCTGAYFGDRSLTNSRAGSEVDLRFNIGITPLQAKPLDGMFRALVKVVIYSQKVHDLRLGQTEGQPQSTPSSYSSSASLSFSSENISPISSTVWIGTKSASKRIVLEPRTLGSLTLSSR